MPESKTSHVGVKRVRGGDTVDTDDVLVVEEPLEIRAAWRSDGEWREKSISVTMRTPGDDLDLAAGFLFTEGLIRSADDIDSLRHWSSPNVLRVADKERLIQVSWGQERHTYPVSVRIRAYDREGLMRDVSSLVANEGINMPSINATTKNSLAVLNLELGVTDISQLSRVLNRLEALPNVLEACRIRPG